MPLVHRHSPFSPSHWQRAVHFRHRNLQVHRLWHAVLHPHFLSLQDACAASGRDDQNGSQFSDISLNLYPQLLGHGISGLGVIHRPHKNQPIYIRTSLDMFNQFSPCRRGVLNISQLLGVQVFSGYVNTLFVTCPAIYQDNISLKFLYVFICHFFRS